MDSRLEETKNFFDGKADTWDNESIYSPNLIKAVLDYDNSNNTNYTYMYILSTFRGCPI